eukprot:TRINITY_DN9570_c0_g2_i3.p1 TRINITY_DN9570_c0_g2~~TRINITY_DN9570_c0_g2_i3.p1  ORF type:complete len:583 (+),score=114.77 TRINITY_DN9570_c0_g2_i3:231-1979(+)
MLCLYGANPRAMKTQGQVSCLYVAAQNGHPEVVECLLQNNADPNQSKDSGATPLFISAQQGNLAIVNILLGAGADPDQCTKTGVTPLMIASYQGHAHIVRALMSAGADPDRVGSGKTAEEWAASNNTLDFVRTALRRPSPQKPSVQAPLQQSMPPARPKAQTPLKSQASPRLTASVLPQQQPLYGLPSPYTEAQTNATPFTRDTVFELESPEKELGPSKAYTSAEPSLAKLFKIKDEPIDLEAGVQRELARRAALRQASTSGGSDPGTKKVGKRGKQVFEPDFVKKEKERAAQYQRETRRFAEAKKHSRPTDYFEDHLDKDISVSTAWEGFKYKLATMEDELQKTSGSVPDKWMFDAMELNKRSAVKKASDEDHSGSLVLPLMSRVIPETSPQRKAREAEERRRPVLKPHNIPYQLDARKVGRLAAAMGATDPEGVQRRVAELANINAGREDKHDSDGEGDKVSHVSGVSDPPSVPSIKPPTPVPAIGSRPPSAVGTASRQASVLSRHSGLGTESAAAMAPAVPAPVPSIDEPPDVTLDPAAGDSDDDHLSQTSAALLARVASRRSSRSQGRAASVASIPEP